MATSRCGCCRAALFVVAAGTAFATGTSWGTMAILMPLAVPLTAAIAETSGMTGDAFLSALYALVSTVLAGAVWGDHVSPISDTTVLSSLASGRDPVDHVRTQMPYAFLAGGVSVLALLLIGLGLTWWLVWPVAVLAVLGGLRLLGEPMPEPDEHEADTRADEPEPQATRPPSSSG